MANRWWSIQTAKIRRMRDIEQDLRTSGQTHYVDFLDDLHRGTSSSPVPPSDPRVTELADFHKLPIHRAQQLARLDHERAGPREVLRYFRWATLAAWVMFLAIRVTPFALRAFYFVLFVTPHRIWFLPGA